MTGVVGLGAEVFARFDQASPEEVLPDAIDLHAGGEGMFFINEPSGQTEAVHFFSLWNGRQDGRKSGSDFFLGLVVFATVKNVGFTRAGKFLHHHDCGSTAL